MRISVKEIGDIMLDMVYPPICPICGEVLMKRTEKVCEKCRETIEYIEEPYCMKCGKSIEEESGEYCGDCRKTEHNFDAGRAVFQYRDGIRNSIFKFKYNNKREFAPFYGEEIISRLGTWIESLSPDAFIPVPLHPEKQRVRGYNQAELIADVLGEYYGIPVINDMVFRVKKTVPQKELSDDMRKKNMKKAFKMAENIVKLNEVIVIDDIYTTGSTMDAVSECLKGAGVEKIYCLSLCIGSGF